ncbi:hypothetical protein BBO99_00004628 [Phytophthora kernoviae]|uniref:Protrudin n=2 Tax=Phytophthora kernoviae TaxID=325452 RepID=A0A3R7KJX2_9STRA|nr:hypothetical protein G195_009302 [Phytophthora kernoviae 00238/432]KAG2515045.1 hypothetical protein JM16_007792 [Phytophthora kernoviae]KAG2518515.1 hypothetical protein JM18_007713 [Phytophthora kernoviae]RLN26666.1 hypothetical protein BBI17_004612 [Phytophthora kernoviae]RLN80251.1 hypothetical protein BBO99_00004628 [Phytophthora kernoviae]
MGDKHAHSGSTSASSGITSPRMAATDYSAILWGNEAQTSTMLPYIRDHAEQMINRARSEDPRMHYQALKQVHDVCLYKRLAQPQESQTTASPLATSITSSFSSLASSRRGVSVTTESAQILGNYDFRGITKVPGTVDSVMDMLSSESARESYWMALNTLKDVRAAVLLSTARLQSQQSIGSEQDTEEDATAFPRWCRKYTAMKLSKHSGKIMDCCFAEYATKCTETNSDSHSRRRGFVYRRSVSEQALINAASVSADLLNKSRVRGAATFYLHDWLFDVVETHEPFVCKLVLTCSVFIPPSRSGATPRSEFREFCTEMLVGTRRALTHQWKDQAAHAGFRSSSWRRESRYCSVCSAQFSLLRKRHTCRSCDSGVCSRTVDDEEVYAEDDLANFTLKLL